MSAEPARESINDPVDLYDELDSIIRQQEVLRSRMVALSTRYAALEPYADRFDEPNPEYPWWPSTYGSMNVESAKNRLEYAARDSVSTSEWLSMAHEVAVKIREYPQPERDDAVRASGNAIADAMVWAAEHDGVER
ncbi:hypothetical protein ACIO52_04535 [Nocardia sp. NPDC087230]|uniref:hypothetical protein n=1 Tax=Nocardia sp. NPDC087230 TaxID=3364331 RepID=UPI00382FB45B